MPRRDDDFDDDYRPRNESDHPRSSGGSLVWLWVLLGVLGVLLVCGGVAVVGMLSWVSARRGAEERVMVAEVAAQERVMEAEQARLERVRQAVLPRVEFERLVVGKTEDEVREALGPPGSQTARGDTVEWTYQNRTTDPTSGGRNDRAAVIRFADGRAERVSYP